jgi:hypothetical protein
MIGSVHVGTVTFDICLDRGGLASINTLRTNLSDLFVYGTHMVLGKVLNPISTAVTVDERYRFADSSIPQFTKILEDKTSVSSVDREAHFTPIFRPFLFPGIIII